MSRYVLAIFGALLVACSAQAAYYAILEPSYVQVRPGETVEVQAYAGWLSGLMFFPFSPMTLTSADASIATVDGFLPTTAKTAVRITGHRPGITRMAVIGQPGASAFSMIVVADNELPLAIGVDAKVLAAGQPLTLRAVSDETDAEFTWFSGRLGASNTGPIGTGREITITPQSPFSNAYWVLMTTPTGAGAAGLSLDLASGKPRRRAAGH